jgi:hypothetical protein
MNTNLEKFPTTVASEAQRHIENLRTWLASHEPREGWSQGQHQAYNDRLRALAGWIAKSQLRERTGG